MSVRSLLNPVSDQPIGPSPPSLKTMPIGSNQPINPSSPVPSSMPLVYLDQLPDHVSGRSIYYKQPQASMLQSKAPSWSDWLKPLRRTKVEDEKEEMLKLEKERGWDRKPLPEVPRTRDACSSLGASSQGASSQRASSPRAFYTVRDLLRDSGIPEFGQHGLTEFGQRDTPPEEENKLIFFGTLDKELVRMIDRRGPPGDCPRDDVGPRFTEPLNLKRKRGTDVSEVVNTSETSIMHEPHGIRLEEHSHIHHHPYRTRDERRNAVVLPNSEIWVKEQEKEDERVKALRYEQQRERARSKRRRVGPMVVEDKVWSGSRNATM